MYIYHSIENPNFKIGERSALLWVLLCLGDFWFFWNRQGHWAPLWLLPPEQQTDSYHRRAEGATNLARGYFLNGRTKPEPTHLESIRTDANGCFGSIPIPLSGGPHGRPGRIGGVF